MCTKRIEVNPQNINFIITNTILSMKNSFTCKQVVEELKKYSIDNENTIKKAIIRLRDNDYLEESDKSNGNDPGLKIVILPGKDEPF